VISAAELASMQATVAQTFTATAMVLHRVSVEDSQGGTVDSYPTGGAQTYPCSYGRTGQVRPVERENQPLVQLVADWTFVFSLEADIRPTDQLVANGRRFDVVDAGVGSLDVLRRVLCLEIT
jgi:hypothetical protein